MVKVQDLVSFELEQAPDQTAVRPSVGVSVMLVPTGKVAVPDEPLLTEMPAGLELTVTPERPLALTVSVAPAATGLGVTVKVVDCETPSVAEMVTTVEAVTALVVMV